jgi:hypothetical protein
MDLIQKIETLISAAARSKLPRRNRHSVLDEEEEKILADIRHALRQVEAQEQVLARKLKEEQAQAEAAEARGDWTEKHTHDRRASELERQLERESIQAINIEEKLAALEEKLALAKEAVDNEARKVAERDAAASQVLNAPQPEPQSVRTPPPDRPKPRDTSLGARKSRLSG